MAKKCIEYTAMSMIKRKCNLNIFGEKKRKKGMNNQLTKYISSTRKEWGKKLTVNERRKSKPEKGAKKV